MRNAREVTLDDGRKFTVDPEGRIYQDGNVRVEEWQLDPWEFQAIDPDRYDVKYGRDTVVCPFSGCEMSVILNDYRSFKMHCRGRHKPLHDKFAKQMKTLDGSDAIRNFVRETQTQVQ